MLQHDSTESKELEQAGTENDQKQKVGRFTDDTCPAAAPRGGWTMKIYSNSLGLVMGTIFLAS